MGWDSLTACFFGYGDSRQTAPQCYCWPCFWGTQLIILGRKGKREVRRRGETRKKKEGCERMGRLGKTDGRRRGLGREQRAEGTWRQAEKRAAGSHHCRPHLCLMAGKCPPLTSEGARGLRVGCGLRLSHAGDPGPVLQASSLPVLGTIPSRKLEPVPWRL